MEFGTERHRMTEQELRALPLTGECSSAPWDHGLLTVPVLLVAHQLQTPLKDYKKFYEAIEKNAARWWHYLDNVWIVATSDNVDTFAKKLYPHMTQSDYLLVIRLAKEYQGWLPEDAWEWPNTEPF